MLPSFWVRGRRSRLASSMRVSVQAFTSGRVICRRHFPIWMTSGTPLPTGTLSRTKSPLVSVSAEAMGLPDTGESQRSQLGPVGMGSRAALGT
jgi:hypothetical protein